MTKESSNPMLRRQRVGSAANVSLKTTTTSGSAIVTAQLLLLLFSLVRFYLGSSRYHEEMPTDGGATELLIDLIGAVSVFVSFYITSAFIKNTNLFFVGFALIHLVDLAWFIVATQWLTLNNGMKKVAKWYIFFDVLTLILLIGFFALDVYWGPSSRYFPQWLISVGCGVVGLWDLKQLWPFYASKTGWKESL